MQNRKTNQEILSEFLIANNQSYPLNKEDEEFWISLIQKCREDEPRINSGLHLLDFCNICDDDDDMDSFYGEDYFKEKP